MGGNPVRIPPEQPTDTRASRNPEYCTALLRRPVSYTHLIVKIDAETRQVLEGAVFKIFDKDRLEIGTYTTNAQGEIFRGSLPAGV